MDASPAGLPLRNVLLLLSLSLLYEAALPPPRATLESPWWFVYILSAPLLFADVSQALALPSLLGLFATRFLFEALSGASAHWTVALSAAPSRPHTPVPPRTTLDRFQPLLPD